MNYFVLLSKKDDGSGLTTDSFDLQILSGRANSSRGFMNISASSIYELYRPSECELRVHLSNKNIQKGEASAFELVLRDLGELHEKRHLHSFVEYINLSKGSLEERQNKTIDAVNSKNNVIYQAVLKAELQIDNNNVFLLGIPDLLILDNGCYVIRDCKISRHADEERHPEILRQLEFYGFLFEKCFNEKPARLEAFLGAGEIVRIEYDGGIKVQQEISKIIHYMKSEPYSPVGWTKCNACGYSEICWSKAVQINDIAVLPDVDQSLARELRKHKIISFDDLEKSYNVESLSEFRKPVGQRLQRVGKKAQSIFRSLQSIKSKKIIKIADFEIPIIDNYVMFDLEGMPPYLDELEKIYLWGTQTFGNRPSSFKAAVSKLGAKGDEQGWFDFLKLADNIFDAYGDIPFIHWHTYEKTKVKLYLSKYGEMNGIADRILCNLFDLLPATRNAFVLPVHSYSLKVLEKLSGYKRSQKEYGGDWAMAQYIKAVETNDETKYDELMEKILLYNREDLEATWAVMQWLKNIDTTLP